VKLFFSFIAGMVVCSLFLFTIRMVLPTQAATDNSGSASENATNGNVVNILTKLIPDIEKIYHESLTMPFKQAEKKIYDKDIAEYFRALMDKTGLVPSE
jgi:hypothetical protein